MQLFIYLFLYNTANTVERSEYNKNPNRNEKIWTSRKRYQYTLVTGQYSQSLQRWIGIPSRAGFELTGGWGLFHCDPPNPLVPAVLLTLISSFFTIQDPASGVSFGCTWLSNQGQGGKGERKWEWCPDLCIHQGPCLRRACIRSTIDWSLKIGWSVGIWYSLSCLGWNKNRDREILFQQTPTAQTSRLSLQSSPFFLIPSY